MIKIGDQLKTIRSDDRVAAIEARVDAMQAVLNEIVAWIAAKTPQLDFLMGVHGDNMGEGA